MHTHTRHLAGGSYPFATKQNREVEQGRQLGTHGVYYAYCTRVLTSINTIKHETPRVQVGPPSLWNGFSQANEVCHDPDPSKRTISYLTRKVILE